MMSRRCRFAFSFHFCDTWINTDLQHVIKLTEITQEVLRVIKLHVNPRHNKYEHQQSVCGDGWIRTCVSLGGHYCPKMTTFNILSFERAVQKQMTTNTKVGMIC